MAKYGFSAAIPYGSDIFEVTGTEYCEWEEALEKAGDDPNAMEWATYDFLIRNGYFVNAPKSERTQTVEVADESKPNGVNSQTRRIPDEFGQFIEGASREPTWTQSRILTERDKLLREREKIQTLKEKALEKKIIEQQLTERMKKQEKVSPIESLSTLTKVAGWVFILMLLLFIGIIVNFK